MSGPFNDPTPPLVVEILLMVKVQLAALKEPPVKNKEKFKTKTPEFWLPSTTCVGLLGFVSISSNLLATIAAPYEVPKDLVSL